VSEIPQPLSVTELRDWAAKWADRLLEIETGVIKEKAAI
jgi:nitrogenase iron protein NifH